MITTEVRPDMAIESASLEQWLGENVDGFAGPLTIRQFTGGQSNPTYLLQTPRREYVLRKKPPGQLLPSAHAVDREYRVLVALAHTDVPVAAPLGLCLDEEVLGTIFYVMEHVSGQIFWNTAFPDVSRERRPEYFDAMNTAIASLHRLDPASVGLADFRKPTGYIPRQIARWSRQYVGDTVAGRVPAMERLIEVLPTNTPPDEEAAIVHGDFRCDNLVFQAGEPRLLAILDWELATLGHPLADFAYHVMMYRMPSNAIPGLLGRDLAALNIPSEADYVAAYCQRTQRSAIAHLDFYIAFCLFRLAGILHGIRGRLARGTAVSQRAREYASHVETIADLGLQHALRGR